MNAVKTEQLMRKMRERALAIEAHPSGENMPERKAQQQKMEELKKLYFNAGRWAGGSRDWTARQAYEKLMTTEGIE